MGLSQIEFFDFSPVKEQQKTKINRLIRPWFFVMVAHSVHNLLML
jgi:hypothetical protein